MVQSRCQTAACVVSWASSAKYCTCDDNVFYFCELSVWLIGGWARGMVGVSNTTDVFVAGGV